MVSIAPRPRRRRPARAGVRGAWIARPRPTTNSQAPKSRNVARERSRRRQLLGRLSGELRRMGIVTVMFHQVMAEKLGLNVTDSRAFSILQETGPIPAGRLAELTGLSTGAVTTIIDRLEEVGYVRRESDPADRRRVIVAPVADEARDRKVEALVGAMMGPLAERMEKYTDSELELILDFLDTGIDYLREQTVRMREEGGEAI